MYRIRTGLIAAVMILAATAVCYLAVTSALKSAAVQEVESKASRAQRVYQHISRLASVDLANLASERARRPSVLAVFAKTDETARRSSAYEECEVLNAAFQKESRKADIIAILDSSGRIIARNLNPNADYGTELRSRYAAVDEALKGNAVKDVWVWQDRVNVVALAPIRRTDGSVAGALLVAWVVSAKTAQESRELLGTEIAYFHDGKVHASSFVASGDASREDVAKTQALSNFLFSGNRVPAGKLSAPTQVMHWTVEGNEYAVVAAPMPGNFADQTSGFATLAALSDDIGRAQSHGTKVLYLGLLAVLIALVAAAMTARRFIAPLDQIELGVGEVINGNIDHTFEPVGPDFEGLSNSLNVMLARLLGRAEPNDEEVDEEDAASRRWKADSMMIAETDGTAPAEAIASLSQESDAAYYTRLYNEYVAALRSSGQPSDGVSVLAFMAKLTLAEGGLRQKWECNSVRFQLATRGGEIVFLPVKIS